MQHTLQQDIINKNRQMQKEKIEAVYKNPNGSFYNNDLVGEGITDEEIENRNRIIDNKRKRKEFLQDIISLEEGKIRYFSSQLKSLEYSIPSPKNVRLSKHYTDKIQEKKKLIQSLEKQLNEIQ